MLNYKKQPQKLYDFYTEIHGTCSTKYFVLFLKGWREKGGVKMRFQNPELQTRLLQKWYGIFPPLSLMDRNSFILGTCKYHIKY